MRLDFLPPAGFNLVFPMEKLFPFSPQEFQTILCGDQAPQWTRDDVLNYTEPKLGYTRERWETGEPWEQGMDGAGVGWGWGVKPWKQGMGQSAG